MEIVFSLIFNSESQHNPIIGYISKPAKIKINAEPTSPIWNSIFYDYPIFYTTGL